MAFLTFLPLKQIWIAFAFSLFILFKRFCIFIRFSSLLFLLLLFLSLPLPLLFLHFHCFYFYFLQLFFTFVYIEYFWILNKWRGRTLLKVGNKDTETVSVSLMGTLSTVCLTYSCDDLLYFRLQFDYTLTKLLKRRDIFLVLIKYLYTHIYI